MKKQLLLTICACIALGGCYQRNDDVAFLAVEHSGGTADSLSFADAHHYSLNYNFTVATDTFFLLRQMPEEIVSGIVADTLSLNRHDDIAVMDIRIVKSGAVDSVWVQVARDQYTFGWTDETRLLANVVPNDPISQFINVFSDTHTLIFLVIISVIAICYISYFLRKHKAKIVHLNDIASFYPAALCCIVAFAATIYSSIQMFAPDVWRHFYYNPTLNPLSLPPLLAVFVGSVWAALIVGIAAIDDIRHLLHGDKAVLYVGGLIAVCAADYIVFSIATLYYVGYALIIAYIAFAVWNYLRHAPRLRCGRCGAPLHAKGRCPECGAENI